jgi:hypothetical protein
MSSPMVVIKAADVRTRHRNLFYRQSSSCARCLRGKMSRPLASGGGAEIILQGIILHL